MIHSQTHPSLDVEGCFACKISGVSLGFSEKMSSEKSRESVLSKDLDAYKRLRMNGQQPKHYYLYPYKPRLHLMSFYH